MQSGLTLTSIVQEVGIASRKKVPRQAFRQETVPNAEALSLCNLDCVFVRRVGCADECLATLAWPYADSDLARCGTWCARRHPRGSRCHDGERQARCRPAVDVHRKRLTANDHAVLAQRNEHWGGGGRVSRRWLSDSRDRSRGHRGLRLADVAGYQLRAAQVPRSQFRAVLGSVVWL